MLRIYGVEGCGPCEVTKLFLSSRNVPFEFVDVSTHPEKRAALEEKLGSATRGVILGDGAHLEVMHAVSIPKLSRYLETYRARHPDT